MSKITIEEVEITRVTIDDYPFWVYYVPSGDMKKPWIRVEEDPCEGFEVKQISQYEYEKELKRFRETK